MKKTIIETIRSAPSDAGVYTFSRQGIPLYIGKANNVRNRLASHARAHDPKTKAILTEADTLTIKPMRSEIEALIQESVLIQKYRPKYNIIFKDDKSYLYVLLSKEKFSRIRIVHRSLLRENVGEIIGPFTDSGALRKTLRVIRRFFPYCTCARIHKRRCINAQIGACSGFCCGDIDASKEEQTSYMRNIRVIKEILRGKNKSAQTVLKRNIAQAVHREDYAAAALLRDRYYAVDRILAHRLYLEDPPSLLRSFGRASKQQTTWLDTIRTIECYDISHLAGKEAVGAATAWKKENGAWVKEKKNWRTYSIRWAPTQDDPRMMGEMLSRRLRHNEWQCPDLIIIDGGITQYNAAARALAEQAPTETDARIIRLISFAKPHSRVFGIKDGSVSLETLSPSFRQCILHAIHETHRFAISFHRKTRSKAFIG